MLADIQAPVMLRMTAELQAEYDTVLGMLLALNWRCRLTESRHELQESGCNNIWLLYNCHHMQDKHAR